MIQITFQAAFDPFHASFRLLRLLEIIKETEGELTIDHARILDFYLLFPFRLDEITLFPKHKRYKRLASKYLHLKPYGEIPDSFVLFARMESMQVAALDTLANKQYLAWEKYSIRVIERTKKTVPPEIDTRIRILNSEQPELVEFIKILFSEYPLYGRNGLKARTGLLEYRYDPI